MLKAVVNQVGLTWKLLFDKRVPFWMKAVALAPFIYVISPIDFIPDFILGLGQLDDIGIILAGMRLFESIVPDHIVQEHRASLGHSLDDNTIEGRSYSIRDGEKAKRG